MSDKECFIYPHDSELLQPLLLKVSSLGLLLQKSSRVQSRNCFAIT